MALTGLKEDALKLILFGGKGGVGKTTCASSAGLYLAREGYKTLVISTDPAHSLSDSLGQKIGDEIKEVKGVKNLSALEVNAQKALSQFKTRYESQIKKIFDTSTYLDQEDIDAFFVLARVVCSAVSSAVALPLLQIAIAVLRKWSGIDRRVITSNGASGNGREAFWLLPLALLLFFWISIMISILSFSFSRLSSIFSRMFKGFLFESSFLITHIPELFFMCTV